MLTIRRPWFHLFKVGGGGGGGGSGSVDLGHEMFFPLVPFLSVTLM